MIRIAVLGANGFIGTRLTEMFVPKDMAAVRPIVRSYSSLARVSRFDLDSRVADACDENALEGAFRGCDVVLHAVAGDISTVLGTLTPVYQAAQRARVRRCRGTFAGKRVGWCRPGGRSGDGASRPSRSRTGSRSAPPSRRSSPASAGPT